MSFIDKFLNIMRLNDDEDEDYDDFIDDYMGEEEEPKRHSFRNRGKQEVVPYEAPAPKQPKPVKQEKTEKPVKTTPKITPISKGSRKQDIGMEVCVIKPTSVEDAREITETLLNGKTILLNVEGLNVEIAQRIIDFTSGSCFAISGNLQMVSNYIFIVTPANVDISGDLESLLGAFDGFGL